MIVLNAQEVAAITKAFVDGNNLARARRRMASSRYAKNTGYLMDDYAKFAICTFYKAGRNKCTFGIRYEEHMTYKMNRPQIRIWNRHRHLVGY